MEQSANNNASQGEKRGGVVSMNKVGSKAQGESAHGVVDSSTLASKEYMNNERKVSQESVIFDTIAIQKIIPHRYPFLLVDRIVEMVDNVSIVGIKAVTINEPYFQGHFPGRPVMPGVLIIEAMAQTAAILAIKSSDGVLPGKTVFLVGASDLRWKKQVIPGDVLRIEMESVKKRRPLWLMKGAVYVDGKMVASGTISAAEAE